MWMLFFQLFKAVISSECNPKHTTDLNHFSPLAAGLFQGYLFWTVIETSPWPFKSADFAHTCPRGQNELHQGVKCITTECYICERNLRQTDLWLCELFASTQAQNIYAYQPLAVIFVVCSSATFYWKQKATEGLGGCYFPNVHLCFFILGCWWVLYLLGLFCVSLRCTQKIRKCQIKSVLIYISVYSCRLTVRYSGHFVDMHMVSAMYNWMLFHKVIFIRR